MVVPRREERSCLFPLFSLSSSGTLLRRRRIVLDACLDGATHKIQALCVFGASVIITIISLSRCRPAEV